MGKFLAIHTVGADLTPESGGPIGKAVKANCNADAYWVRSWYTPEDGKFYCEWDAKDADAVRKVCTAAVAQAGMPFPLDAVVPITMAFDGEAYR